MASLRSQAPPSLGRRAPPQPALRSWLPPLTPGRVLLWSAGLALWGAAELLGTSAKAQGSSGGGGGGSCGSSSCSAGKLGAYAERLAAPVAGQLECGLLVGLCR